MRYRCNIHEAMIILMETLKIFNDYKAQFLETSVARRTNFITCLLLFSLANIAERRVRPYVCVIV